MFSQMIDLMLYETDCYNNILYLGKDEQTDATLQDISWIYSHMIIYLDPEFASKLLPIFFYFESHV